MKTQPRMYLSSRHRHPAHVKLTQIVRYNNSSLAKFMKCMNTRYRSNIKSLAIYTGNKYSEEKYI